MKKRILIVDDEVSMSRLLKLNLEATGHYDVRVENVPEEALPAAQEFRPNLIFLDIMMPRVFGGDIANQIRAHDTLGGTPVVFLTAAISRDRIEEHDGAINGFPVLPKPATLDDLVQCIERYASGSLPTTP